IMIQPFLTEVIFDNYGANNFCDHLCNLIVQPDEKFPSDFALTGRAAYELQNPTGTPCSNIVFVTWNLEHFLILAREIEKFNIKDLVRYQELLKFKYKSGNIDLCIEIYYESKETYIVRYGDVGLIHYELITNNLL